MVSIKFVSAFAAAALMSTAAAQSSSSIFSIPTPTTTVPAAAMKTVGCFSTGVPLDNHGAGNFNTDGQCQQICLGLDKPVQGMVNGTHCFCGDLLPPTDTKVNLDECDVSCPGFPEKQCGGKNRWLVILTGQTNLEVDSYEPPASSSSAASSSSQTSAPASSASAALQTATESSESGSGGGPNKVGIAVGVVVGVIALAAIIGGVLFYLRQKKRKEVEEEYRRQAAVSSFVSGGKLHTSNSSMTDSRLDPEFMNRRQSNGSIADNEDYSRRILKVTNA